MTERMYTLLALVLFMLLAACAAGMAQPVIRDQGYPSLPAFLIEQGEWDDRFASNINGHVNNIQSYGNEFYITGSFTEVANVVSRGFAHWDGKQWHGINADTLGFSIQPPGIGGFFKMAVDSSGNMYTLGTTGMWMYNRTMSLWSRLAVQPPGSVYTIACSDSTIYVSGDFIADSATHYTVAAWNGKEWTMMAKGLPVQQKGRTIALCWTGKHLLAGVTYYLDSSGTLDTLAHVLQWDGEQWETLGSELKGEVWHLVEFRGTPIAISTDVSTTMIGTTMIAAYDSITNTWMTLDSLSGSYQDRHILSMKVIHDSLYITGYMSNKFGGLATFDLSSRTWSPFGQQILGPDYRSVQAVAALPDGIIVGGSFEHNHIAYLARWNDNQWTQIMPSGFNGIISPVWQLATYQHQVYALSWMEGTGNRRISCITRWDGSQWHTIPEVSYNVESIVSDSTGVYFGIRTVPARDTLDVIWHHDTSWISLGLKATGRINAVVSRGNDLYIGGRLRPFRDSSSSDTSYFGIAHLKRLTGEWSWLDSRMYRGVSPEILAVAVSGRNVIVGGNFDSIGTIAAKNTARWDGTGWHPIGEGFAATVRALCFTPDGRKLYAGGDFLSSGQRQLEFLAESNGTDWYSIEGSPAWAVHALAATDQALYAGGEGEPGIVRHDMQTKTWSQLGEGIAATGTAQADVRALAVDGEEIYAGGRFTMAGGKPSHNFAHWSPKTSSVRMGAVPAATASFTGIMPNPAGNTTTIRFTLPHSGDAMLTIHSAIGEQVAVAASGQFPAGEHTVQWNTEGLADGIYFCQLRFAGTVATERIVLIR